MLLRDSFRGLRIERRGFGIDFHSIALSLQFRVGWIVLRRCITTGGANLDSLIFMLFNLTFFVM